MDIKNKDEVIEEIKTILMDFDKECSLVDTDIYLYYDDSTHMAHIDTFENPGGNSWLDDDHYFVYQIKGYHYEYEPIMDTFDLSDIAYALDMDEAELISEAKDYFGEDVISEQDIRDYVYGVDGYVDRLEHAFAYFVDENEWEYEKQATIIFEDFINYM